MSYTGNAPAEQYISTVKDTFNGDGSTTDFTLSRTALVNNLEVFVENVQQEPTTAYTVSGTTLSFTSAPVSGTGNIYVIHRGQAVQTVVPPAGISLNATDASITNGLTVDKDGATVATFDRATDDGTIVDLQKDGSSVGSIGTNSSAPYFVTAIGSSTVGLKIQGGSQPRVVPTNGSGVSTDNLADLGVDVHRWKDLYLSGGVYLGGTGAANKLDDYEEGTFTPYLSNDSGTDLIGTYGEQYGTYAKIGERVYFTIRCTSGSGLSGTAGQLRVQGLPYVQSSSGFEAYVSMYLWFYSGLGGLSSGDVLISRGQISGTYLVIQKQNGGVSNSVTNTDFGNSLNMSICGHYKTPS